MKKITVNIIFFLCFVGNRSFAQTALIDSLHKKVYAANNSQQKLDALIALCEQYQSLQRDSLDLYAPEITSLAKNTHNKRYQSLAALINSYWYQRWGWADSSLAFLEPEFSRNPVDNADTRDIYFKLSRAKAMSLGSKSRMAEALEVLYKMLPEAEKYKDTLNIGLTCNTIGSITIARQQAKEALSWMQKAIDIAGKTNRFEQVLAPAYLNMANAYVLLGKRDSASYYIRSGLPLCEKIQNLFYTATALRIQANIYKNEKKYNEAEKALLQMIAIRKKINPVNFYVEDNLQLADFYATSGQVEKAIAVCEENLNKGDLHTVANTSQTLNNDPKVRLDYLEVLAQYYKQANKLSKYQSTLEELLAAKDSFYQSNSAEAIATVQTSYEVQKKENTILQQKIDLQRQHFLLYGVLLLTALLIITSVLLFINYRKKQRQKIERMMKEEQKQAEERIKKAEEKERARIASDLHDNLGAYAAALASNISYIDIPPTDEKNQNALAELAANSNAIISQLNDTIWVLKKDALNLTAISDRVKNFIAKIKKSYPAIDIEVKEKISNDQLLPSSQAFHLYSIIQEAINNALKHSNGNAVLVTIESADLWMVSIEDNGNNTFSVNELKRAGGNGLGNMKRRSDEAGWHISWKNKTTGPGTVVTIQSGITA